MNLKKLLAYSAAAGATALLAGRLQRHRRRIDFQDQCVIITGGSRGLGIELARQFAAEGAKLALLARDETELERAKNELRDEYGADVLTQVCDIRQQQEIRRAIQRVRQRFGHIEVLINNAGVIEFGPAEHMEREDYEEAMGIHFWAPLQLMREVLPEMRSRGRGRIVNIASIGGLVSLPHALPYCASKFALVGLSNGLRDEFRRHGVRVTTVCPGLMRTGSHYHAQFKGQHRKEFVWFATANAMPAVSSSARRAAEKILDACRHGDPFLVINFSARVAHLTDTLFPGLLARVFQMSCRMLPGETDLFGNEARSGWQSQSTLAPSWFTRRADAAAAANNQLLPEAGEDEPLQPEWSG
ncbi:MAG: SDR family NAD(P)-dependent oxidoreductase [Phycisphaeraceae bacterium]